LGEGFSGIDNQVSRLDVRRQRLGNFGLFFGCKYTRIAALTRGIDASVNASVNEGRPQ
jgi:hypothetical protein